MRDMPWGRKSRNKRQSDEVIDHSSVNDESVLYQKQVEQRMEHYHSQMYLDPTKNFTQTPATYSSIAGPPSFVKSDGASVITDLTQEQEVRDGDDDETVASITSKKDAKVDDFNLIIW